MISTFRGENVFSWFVLYSNVSSLWLVTLLHHMSYDLSHEHKHTASHELYYHYPMRHPLHDSVTVTHSAFRENIQILNHWSANWLTR